MTTHPTIPISAFAGEGFPTGSGNENPLADLRQRMVRDLEAFLSRSLVADGPRRWIARAVPSSRHGNETMVAGSGC